MTKKLVRGLGLGWIVLLVAASCVSTEDPDTENNTSGSDRSGEDIQSALNLLPDAHVVDVDDHGVPTFVIGQLGRLPVDPMTNSADLKAPVKAIAGVFRANADALTLKATHVDNEGHHFRLGQTKNGLEVIGGELLVHAQNGAIIATNGAARHDLKAPLTPKIAESDAISTAKSNSTSIDQMIVADKAALAYRPATAGETMDLVYVVKVTGVDKAGTPVDDDVLVNAVDGSVRERIPHIHTAKNREVHNLNHGTSLPGPTTQIEGGPVSGDSSVSTNYNLLGTVYDCYKNLFNRDSYDNAGAKMISSVHYSNGYNNAYWNGTQMVYGDGDNSVLSDLSKSMDVTAHELTHAVTERTSNLTYSGQSGGLNEAMSDIFGNVCEWYRDGQVVSANTWKVGEDIYTPGTAGDALRYMNNPSLDGSSLDYYPNFSSGVDVHYSSGIANLAFYLLSQGGTHPKGKTTTNVTGIGILKAAQVFYKANTSIMTASTTFAGAKTACENAATQLGLTAAEQASVSNAWLAVGVGSAPPPPPPPGGGTLTNGVAVSVSGALNSKSYFTLAVTAGATALKFVLSGGTGDADMYVKFGSQPTTSSYDCRPYLAGNNETCNIASAQTGTYHVMLNGYSAYSGASLKGSFTAGGGGACAHSKCSTGVALTNGCDPCVTTICGQDPFCCTSSWDSQCVGEVSSICGISPCQ